MDHNSRRARAAEEAAEWLMRMQSEDLGRLERVEFAQWLRDSPLHVAEMLRISRVHARLADFPHWGQVEKLDAASLEPSVLEFPIENEASAQPARKPARQSWRLLGAVAAGCAALVVALTWQLRERHSQTIQTSIGERRNVTLADGSIVSVSPDSTLRLRFNGQERLVSLCRGDALFRVAKDTLRPFIVQAGDTRVRAVGTAFGVERHDDSVTVTVEEGRVAVAQAAATQAPLLKSPDLTEVSLGADQQVILPRSGPIGPVRNVDSQRELAWAEGRLVFNNTPVSEVVRRFNKFNHVQMQVVDSNLSTQQVSAVFDASDPEAFIIFLESVANVRVTRPSADDIVINAEGPL